MIRVLEFFGTNVTKHPEVLAKCFADTKEEVVKDAEVVGIPTGCVLGAGSEVTVSDGSKGYLKSDGNWNWVTSGGGEEPVLVEKSITANGTYDPADDEADGYSEVSVLVPGITMTEGAEYSMAFSNNTYIESIVFPDGITEIVSSAFSNCTNLESIVIPSTVTTIGGDAFSGCTSLMSVTCKATTPPSLNDSFASVPEECVAYVPAESISAYEEDWGWTSNFQPIPTT